MKNPNLQDVWQTLQKLQRLVGSIEDLQNLCVIGQLRKLPQFELLVRYQSGNEKCMTITVEEKQQSWNVMEGEFTPMPHPRKYTMSQHQHSTMTSLTEKNAI